MAVFYNPTKIIFGWSCVTGRGNEIAQCGRKAVLVTGRNSSKKNGALDDVRNVLEMNAVPYALFDRVEPDPSIETVCDAARMATDEGCDFCIGIGGGSALDAAKAVAVLLRSPDETANPERIFFEERKADYSTVVAIPTTCGTGSEVTPFSVLTDRKKGVKRTVFSQLYPQLALINAQYLYSASHSDCVSPYVDALAHLIESFLAARADEYSRMYAKEGLVNWKENMSVMHDPERFSRMSDAQKERLMYTAMLGGMSIAVNGTTLPHGLANSITQELHVPHGRAVASFLPGFLRNYERQETVQTALELLGCADVNELEDYLFGIIGSVSIPCQLWDDIVYQMLQNEHKLSSYPYKMTEEILRNYLGKLLIIEETQNE